MTKHKEPTEILIDHEKRLSRLEILMYITATLSGLNLLGVKVFDGITLLSRTVLP